MAKFKYIAIKKDGSTVNGELESASRGTALQLIQGQGLKLVDLKDASDEKKGLSIGRGRKKGVPTEELVGFTRQLSTMVSAGVPILRSLNAMAQHAESANFRDILHGVAKEIEGGISFADALEKYPQAFSDVYINMVRAGEAGGILDDILKRLALQQEKNSSMKKKIKSAMTYPMVLIFITIGAFFGLMIFVLPAIGKTIKDLAGEDAELPALTTALMGMSQFMVTYWYILIPVIVGAIYGLIRYIKTPRGKVKFHHFVLKAPILKTIVRKVAVARFTRTFSALIGAGVSVLEALEVTARAVGNKVYEDSLMEAAKRIKNGEVLSKIINEREDLYPPIVGQMLSVGEETGQTDKVLVKVADFYEEEVDTAIAGLSSTIEPVMIVFMGGMVGLIAAAVMMPITGLANQIKG
ncbi:MAG: type II secretion system F family protein [Candidatus Saccharibacteria bacterium]|nr:type II secretion system F family protein [Candidatus Saccharibacteria bacterium]